MSGVRSWIRLSTLTVGATISDYRRLPRELSKVYFSPLTSSTRLEIEKLFDAMTTSSSGPTSDPVIENRPLRIWGRTLKVPLSTSNVAKFTFHELCGQPLSSADYLEITKTFDTIFLEEVPRMGMNEKDMVSRRIVGPFRAADRGIQ